MLLRQMRKILAILFFIILNTAHWHSTNLGFSSSYECSCVHDDEDDEIEKGEEEEQEKYTEKLENFAVKYTCVYIWTRFQIH
jgi:hypothetical protein